ncbi:MAG: polymer-forming cytoskeletal protein [Actinomycetota bacterium]
MRRLSIAGLLALAVSAGHATAASAADLQEDLPPQVVLSGRIEVPAGQAVGEAVIFHGSVRVAGEVRGDVVALDGPVTVSGLVNGDVVSLNGRVDITGTARVTGDVLAGDEIKIESGAAVDGETRQIAGYLSLVRLVGRLAWWIPVSFSTLLFGLILLLVAPRAANAIAAAASQSPWASIGWGVAAFVGLPFLSLLSSVTLVGIPFGIGLLLALGLLYAAGYTWSAWILGRTILKPPWGRIPAFLLGWLILRAVALIPYAGGWTWVLATVFGLGGTTVAIYRGRREPAAHEATAV